MTQIVWCNASKRILYQILHEDIHGSRLTRRELTYVYLISDDNYKVLNICILQV